MPADMSSPLTWLRVSVTVTAGQAPAAETALETLGALVTWSEQAGGGPVLEPAPGETPLWTRVRLTGLFPADTDEQLLGIAVGAAIPGAIPEFSQVTDRDWDAEWRRQLRPMRFGRRVWICPPGHAAPHDDAAVVVLEPGMAFGTGTHATTALCLEWLDAHPPRAAAVLDYGCGSGILGLAALALGADHVVAVDIDAQALQATRENAVRNGYPERLRLLAPGALPAAETFGLIMGNILSGILVELAPTLARHAAPGGQVALSGVLEEQAGEVIEAYRPWVSLRVTAAREGWGLLTGEKPHAA